MEQMIEFYQQTKDIDYRAVSETLRKAVEMERLTRNFADNYTRWVDAQIFQSAIMWQNYEPDWLAKKDNFTRMVQQINYHTILQLLDYGHGIECALYDEDPDTETLHRMIQADKLCEILENLIEE
jgi:hypothetical protein